MIGLGDEGVAFGEPMRKLGDRGIVNSELFLDDAFVPDANRIGEEGQGFVGLMRTFDKSRIVLASGCVGIARAAYEYAAQYARERMQFGKPIVEHQAVGFRLADVAMRIDAARLLTWRAAEAFDRGETVTAHASMAKLYASEACMFATWARRADARRLGLLARVPGREVVPRREAARRSGRAARTSSA